MDIFSTDQTLSSFNLDYYGSLSFKKKNLITADSLNIPLYDLFENPVDYNKSVVLTDSKMNADVFNQLKSNILNISFVSYIMVGEDTYLKYNSATDSISAETVNSLDALDDNHFFEFILSGGNLYIKKSIYLNDSLDSRITSYSDNLFDEKFLSYSMSSFQFSSYGDYQGIPLDDQYVFNVIFDYENDKFVLFKPNTGIIKLNSQNTLEFSSISSEITDSSIFNFINLNNILEKQSLENSFFPLYDDNSNEFFHRYFTDNQFLTFINEKSLVKEKNTNLAVLKNNVSNTQLHSLAKYRQKQRRYDKIYSGESNIDFDQIYLGYSSELYTLELDPDKITYFHMPSNMDPYIRLNVNDSNLIEDGAVGGNSPTNSDKIFKKNFNYGRVSNTGNPQGLLNGQYLCSWLYYNPVEPDKSVWLDRYYSPKKVTKLDALSATTYDVLQKFYESVGVETFTLSTFWESVRVGDFISSDVFGYSLSGYVFGGLEPFVIGKVDNVFERTGIFDVKSALTFEPECLYAYHHIGKNASEKILKKYDSNLVVEDFDQFESRNINGEKYYDLDGTQIFSKDLSYALDNGEITITFDLITDNPEQIRGEQLIGNYTNESGFGLFRDYSTTPFQYAFNDNELHVYDYGYNKISLLELPENERIQHLMVVSPFLPYYVYGKNDRILYEISQGNSIINRLELSSYPKIADKTPYSIEAFAGAVHMLTDNGTIVWVNIRNNESFEYGTANYYDPSINAVTATYPASATNCISITNTHGLVVLLDTYKFEVNSEDRIFFYDNSSLYLSSYPKALKEYKRETNLLEFEDDGIVDFIIDQSDNMYVLTYKGKLYIIDYSKSKTTAYFVDTYFENTDKSLSLNYYIEGGEKKNYLEVINSQTGQIQRYNKDLSQYNVLSSYDITGKFFNNFNSSRIYKYFGLEKEFNYRLTLENIYDETDVRNINIPIKYSDLRNQTTKFTLVVNNDNGKVVLYINDVLYYSVSFPKNKYYFNSDILDKPVYVGMSTYNFSPINSIIGNEQAYVASGYSIKNFKVYDTSFNYYDVLTLNRRDKGNGKAVLNAPMNNRSYVEEITGWFLQNKHFRKSEYVDINIYNPYMTKEQENTLSSYIKDTIEKNMDINQNIRNVNFY